MNTAFKTTHYPQMGADFKPVEFNPFSPLHPSQLTLQTSWEVLGYGE